MSLSEGSQHESFILFFRDMVIPRGIHHANIMINIVLTWVEMLSQILVSVLHHWVDFRMVQVAIFVNIIFLKNRPRVSELSMHRGLSNLGGQSADQFVFFGLRLRCLFLSSWPVVSAAVLAWNFLDKEGWVTLPICVQRA